MPNGTCIISITFTPTTTGARQATVNITDNTLSSPQMISLTGTGTGLSVSPRVTALTFTEPQQFTASSGGATWSVDGIVGGSASLGTITAAGLYTPPSAIGTHTVTATSGSSQASATVFITNYAGALTYHYDNLRTGQNSNEAVLTLANVNQTQFGKLFSYATDGASYSSPLYVANVNIRGRDSITSSTLLRSTIASTPSMLMAAPELRYGKSASSIRRPELLLYPAAIPASA